MTEDRRNDQHQERPAAGKPARRAWKRPSLTAYGPIGKLTQGGTGFRSDGSSGRRR